MSGWFRVTLRAPGRHTQSGHYSGHCTRYTAHRSPFVHVYIIEDALIACSIQIRLQPTQRGTMRRKLWLLQLVVVLTALMLTQTASAARIVRKISGVMPAFGDVSIDAPTRRSSHATARTWSTSRTSESTRCSSFSAPVYTNEPRTLLTLGCSLAAQWRHLRWRRTAKNWSILWTRDLAVATGPLYRVAVSGPPSVQLGGPPITGDVVDFKLSRDSGASCSGHAPTPTMSCTERPWAGDRRST